MHFPIRAADVAAPSSRSELTPAPQVTAPELAKEAHTPLYGIRVLAVDDDADSLELRRTILEDAGALVTTATSAIEAVT